jgi:hypothetical protein
MQKYSEHRAGLDQLSSSLKIFFGGVNRKGFLHVSMELISG